ncbi:MAG: glycosyltransferase [Synergistetes bacterium]|nr:glycosyltransferase [Synergistota bacterium]
MEKIKIAHIITDLDVGGAEVMLYKLLKEANSDEFLWSVVSMMEAGMLGAKIEKLGVPVLSLGMKRGVPSLAGVVKLARFLRDWQPDIVQTWMYHADLIGGVIAKIMGRIHVVWGIHHSNLDIDVIKRRTVLVAKLCAWLSRWVPDKIICCSNASLKVHASLGYDSTKMVVVPNGFDTKVFKPDTQARISVRNELGVSEDTVLVGMIARFHPMKGHKNFITSASKICEDGFDVHFLMCGRDVTWKNKEIATLIDKFDLRKCFHILGEREDIPRIMASLDVFVSSSSGEAFPNVIGEAMACGVPCVVTDVGDSALIVDDTGRVVLPKDASSLAEAIESLLDMSKEDRKQLGFRARKRIMENFSISEVVKRYEEIYRTLCH